MKKSFIDIKVTGIFILLLMLFSSCNILSEPTEVENSILGKEEPIRYFDKYNDTMSSYFQKKYNTEVPRTMEDLSKIEAHPLSDFKVVEDENYSFFCLDTEYFGIIDSSGIILDILCSEFTYRPPNTLLDMRIKEIEKEAQKFTAIFIKFSFNKRMEEENGGGNQFYLILATPDGYLLQDKALLSELRNNIDFQTIDSDPTEEDEFYDFNMSDIEIYLQEHYPASEPSEMKEGLNKLKNDVIDIEQSQCLIAPNPEDESELIFVIHNAESEQEGFNFYIGLSDKQGNVISKYGYLKGTTFLILDLDITKIFYKGKDYYVVTVLHTFRTQGHPSEIIESSFFLLDGEEIIYDETFEDDILRSLYDFSSYQTFINKSSNDEKITPKDYTDEYMTIVKELLESEFSASN